MSIAFNEIEHQTAQTATATQDLAQILIIAQSQALLDKLAQNMAGDDDVQGHSLHDDFVNVVDSGTQNWDFLNFVVFEVGNDMMADLNAVRGLLAGHASTLHCVAVSPNQMTETTRDCYLSAGVVEVLVLTQEAEASELTTPIAASTSQAIVGPVAAEVPAKPATSAGGDLTVVMRARGGAGATTVAVNLAIDIAAEAEPGRIALVDLDLQNGSIGLSLDLPESAELTALLRGEKVIEGNFLERAMVPHSSGINVLTSPDVFAPLSAMTPQIVSGLIKELKTRYDHIIFDLPQAIMDWTNPVLAEASRVLIVSDMSVPSVKRVRRLIDLISEEHMTLPIRTVINFEKRPLVPSQVHKEAARLIGQSLDHWIPSDPGAARRAVDMGVPMRLGARRSGTTKAISALRKSLFTKSKKG